MNRVPGGEARKGLPLATGVLDFFPSALLAVAAVSVAGAQQHNAFNTDGTPALTSYAPSLDADALMRHFLDRGDFDTDGLRHSAKVAWRALRLLQRELDDAVMLAAIRTPDPPPESLTQDEAAKIVAGDDGAEIPAFLKMKPVYVPNEPM